MGEEIKYLPPQLGLAIAMQRVPCPVKNLHACSWDRTPELFRMEHRHYGIGAAVQNERWRLD